MTERAVLMSRLEEARAALHRLNVGDQEIEVDFDGHRVKFAAPNRGELRRYIGRLERELGLAGSGGARSRRVTF